MDLDAQGLDVIGSVGSSSEVRKVELDLVPTLIEPHRHRTYERFNSGCSLVIRRSKSSPDILVVEHLHLKSEILF